MRKPKHFYVYTMTNNQRFHVLYTGITGDLPRRVHEHKGKLTPGFTSKYNLTRLVHCEMFAYPGDAIQREKEIKGWVRSKKIKLIESTNPNRHDLAADWENLYKPVDRRQADPRQILPGLTATQDDVKN
jgi:putative endonuclease